jgi:hypothetical protein
MSHFTNQIYKLLKHTHTFLCLLTADICSAYLGIQQQMIIQINIRNQECLEYEMFMNFKVTIQIDLWKFQHKIAVYNL